MKTENLLLINCQTTKGVKNILIDNELISYVGTAKPEADKVLDCSGLIVLPGMIDPHVHVRDLDLANKETWKTASEAAIAGGVTTIIDMPNTKPPTTDFTGLAAKRKKAKTANVNYKFHLGATENNLEELHEILSQNPSDIAGIKLFLAGSSSNEVVEDSQIIKQIFRLARDFDKIVLVHSERQSVLNIWRRRISSKTIQNHNVLRNRKAAISGTKLILDLGKEIGNYVYLCHISTWEEVELIRQAKHENEKIFCEVTPHHLVLTETILNRTGNLGKVNPPLRTQKDNLALLEAIKDGTIDCLGSDHAPHNLTEKLLSYETAPAGFPGLETAIPMTFRFVTKGSISLERFSELISGNAARIFNIEGRGKIAVGNYADLVIIDPQKKIKISSHNFRSKAKYSPFEGMIGDCQVKMCFVKGKNLISDESSQNQNYRCLK